MTLKNTLIFAAIIGALFITALIIAFTVRPYNSLASVGISQEYMATTTGSGVAYGNTITGTTLIRTGSGAFGSINITGANTGLVNIYNATTTDITKRAPSMSTSTILIASLPTNLAVGTYTYDAMYNVGLLVDLVSGVMPTSTVTYR